MTSVSSGGAVKTDDSRSLKGQTWTLLASVTADHPCHTHVGISGQRFLFVTQLFGGRAVPRCRGRAEVWSSGARLF